MNDRDFDHTKFNTLSFVFSLKLWKLFYVFCEKMFSESVNTLSHPVIIFIELTNIQV